MTISSSVAIDELFVAFPAWKDLARKEMEDDGSEFVVVEVSAPREADVKHGLVISTSNEEVTVTFDFYHSHFDDWIGDGTHFGTTAAIEFVKQILDEKVAVISWWWEEEWRGSAQLEIGTALEVPEWAPSSKYDRVRIRSWQGTFNSEGLAPQGSDVNG